jgi:protein-tyrosine phosphatase
MPSRILVVCTGNICRSPAAALLLDRRTDASVTVESAGVAALDGHEISGPMAVLLQERGISTDGFAARTLTPDLVADAALVVTMTRAQRAQTVRLDPRAVRRTFTLLELALLLDGAPHEVRKGEDDAARLALVPDLAASQRRRMLDARTPLDVPDPYGRSERVYRRALEAIESAVEVLARTVHPPSATLGSWSPNPPTKRPPAAGQAGTAGATGTSGTAGAAGPGLGEHPDGREGGIDGVGPVRHRTPRHGTRRRLW